MLSPLMGKNGGYSNFQGHGKILITPEKPWDIYSDIFHHFSLFKTHLTVASMFLKPICTTLQMLSNPWSIISCAYCFIQCIEIFSTNKTLQNFKNIFLGTMYFSHGQKFPKNLQGCEFEKTPVSTSDIFMTIPSKTGTASYFLH